MTMFDVFILMVITGPAFALTLALGAAVAIACFVSIRAILKLAGIKL